jgi:hypothetical protein
LYACLSSDVKGSVRISEPTKRLKSLNDGKILRRLHSPTAQRSRRRPNSNVVSIAWRRANSRAMDDRQVLARRMRRHPAGSGVRPSAHRGRALGDDVSRGGDRRRSAPRENAQHGVPARRAVERERADARASVSGRDGLCACELMILRGSRRDERTTPVTPAEAEIAVR